MYQMPDLVIAGRPKAHHAARVAVRFPQVRVDLSIRIERRDQRVAIAGAAGRVSLFAGKLKTDLAESAREFRYLRHDLHAFMLARA